MTDEDRSPQWWDDFYEVIAELPHHPEDVQAAIRRELAKDPVAASWLHTNRQT